MELVSQLTVHLGILNVLQCTHDHTDTRTHPWEFHLSLASAFASIYRQLVFSKLYLRQGEMKKKIYTTSLHKSTGYKERVGESFKRLQRWTGEREKQTSVAVPATFLPFAAPPIPASPRLGGLNNCSWWGGKCSLCSFSAPLGVLPTLSTLAISCRLTLSDFHTHGNTNTRINTQRCAASEPSTLSAPSHLPMWGSL